jgi:hypothetical protein
MNLTPFFDAYLRHAAIPVLEIEHDEAQGTWRYKWDVDEPNFAMPIQFPLSHATVSLVPATAWQSWQMPAWIKGIDASNIADLEQNYYVKVQVDTISSEGKTSKETF